MERRGECESESGERESACGECESTWSVECMYAEEKSSNVGVAMWAHHMRWGHGTPIVGATLQDNRGLDVKRTRTFISNPECEGVRTASTYYY